VGLRIPLLAKWREMMPMAESFKLAFTGIASDIG